MFERSCIAANLKVQIFSTYFFVKTVFVRLCE